MREMTRLKPAESLSVRQRTYADLKELILSGGVRPAERLLESELSLRLGVSRTPLREALMKLEEEGLVTGRRNAGYAVTDLDIGKVRDLLVVREALDACAAEIACDAATAEDLEAIRAVMAELDHFHAMKEKGSVELVQELAAGLRIHEVIAAATRNDALIRLSGQVHQQLRLALWLEVSWVELGDTGIREHRAIVDALVARDRHGAAAAAREHVQSSLRNMARVQQVLQARRGARA